MSPEQLRGEVDRRPTSTRPPSLLWEALTGRRRYEGMSDVEIYGRVMEGHFEPPSKYAPDIPPVRMPSSREG